MFDLDGTLIDSRPGIKSSARAALEEVGLDPYTPIEAAWLSAPLAGLIESLMPGVDLERDILAAVDVARPGLLGAAGIVLLALKIIAIVEKAAEPPTKDEGHYSLDQGREVGRDK